MPEPTWIRRRADAIAHRAPGPVGVLLKSAVDTGFDTMHLVLDVTDYYERNAAAHAVVDPVYEEAVGPTRPTRERATAQAHDSLDAARG